MIHHFVIRAFERRPTAVWVQVEWFDLEDLSQGFPTPHFREWVRFPTGTDSVDIILALKERCPHELHTVE